MRMGFFLVSVSLFFRHARISPPGKYHSSGFVHFFSNPYNLIRNPVHIYTLFMICKRLFCW